MSSDLRFLVSFETEPDKYGTYSGETFRAKAHLIHMIDGKVRNISDDSWSDPDTELADIEITAILDQASVKNGTGHLYGYELEFKPFRVRKSQARNMVKVFNRVESKLAKLEEELGPAEDFGEWLTRLGVVLKAKLYGTVRDRPAAAWSHDDLNYRWNDAAGIRHEIARREREFVAKHTKATTGEAVSQ